MDRLQLYALYKYVTVGPKPATSRPSIFDMSGRAKWDAWSSLGDKNRITTPTQAEGRYLELCKELGWVPDAATIHKANIEEEEEGDIDWDAPDDPATRPAGTSGMANAVSVLQKEEEEPLDLNTLHGVVLAGDLERLKAMETEETDLDALDEFVS
jgi:acyl-CoA-binding protein